ncbi:MAG: hypothetical protein GY757_09015 [bacterium]|nr:hypothetical protein [bacterium]
MSDKRTKDIKELLKEYPKLAGVLEEYDINCFQCDGNCKMKDVTEEHNLSMKDEMEYAAKVAGVIKESDEEKVTT